MGHIHVNYRVKGEERNEGYVLDTKDTPTFIVDVSEATSERELMVVRAEEG